MSIESFRLKPKRSINSESDTTTKVLFSVYALILSALAIFLAITDPWALLQLFAWIATLIVLIWAVHKFFWWVNK